MKFEPYRIVKKDWGEECWIELNSEFCFKRIVINAGHKTSLQYHNHKRESMYIVSGRAIFYTKDDSRIVIEGDTIIINPGEVHRLEAIEDLVLFEASTPEVWDVVRLEDAYGREGTSDA